MRKEVLLLGNHFFLQFLSKLSMKLWVSFTIVAGSVESCRNQTWKKDETERTAFHLVVNPVVRLVLFMLPKIFHFLINFIVLPANKHNASNPFYFPLPCCNRFLCQYLFLFRSLSLSLFLSLLPALCITCLRCARSPAISTSAAVFWHYFFSIGRRFFIL
jgi:hypothetical protein